jgi:hypothetical protein
LGRLALFGAIGLYSANAPPSRLGVSTYAGDDLMTLAGPAIRLAVIRCADGVWPPALSGEVGVASL